MNTKDLIRLGVPPGETTRRGMEFISRYILKGLDKAKLTEDLEAVVRDPASFVEDELRGEFAKSLVRCGRTIREAAAPWRQWGEGLEPEAINQMGRACQLPVAVAGALGNVDSSRRTLTTSPPIVAVGVTWLIALPARRTMKRRQNDTAW